mmetsp:Transcript_16837/g.26138  ORF Transcript_16837/g.26138 Transcript_16837/m.26138 type:complete len:316 (-) Transcript_16837:316-1263(-)
MASDNPFSLHHIDNGVSFAVCFLVLCCCASASAAAAAASFSATSCFMRCSAPNTRIVSRPCPRTSFTSNISASLIPYVFMHCMHCCTRCVSATVSLSFWSTICVAMAIVSGANLFITRHKICPFFNMFWICTRPLACMMFSCMTWLIQVTTSFSTVLSHFDCCCDVVVVVDCVGVADFFFFDFDFVFVFLSGTAAVSSANSARSASLNGVACANVEGVAVGVSCGMICLPRLTCLRFGVADVDAFSGGGVFERLCVLVVVVAVVAVCRSCIVSSLSSSDLESMSSVMKLSISSSALPCECECDGDPLPIVASLFS